MMVNLILNGGQYNPTGDVNSDGQLNVVDVVMVVNLILTP